MVRWAQKQEKQTAFPFQQRIGGHFMPNISKIRELRFWQKWRKSGAMGSPCDVIPRMNLWDLGFGRDGLGSILGLAVKEREFSDESMFSRPPFNPIDKEGIHKLMEEVGESLLKTEADLKSTTAADVLAGWRQNHAGYINMKDVVMRNFHLKNMKELFLNLLKFGYPMKKLVEIPGSEKIFKTRSWDEFRDHMMHYS